MAKDIIVIKDLEKKFGEFTAVDKMNLIVRDGEILGFLGPNGAGKTTTISMLTTLIRPTSGSATIAGYDLLRDDVDVRAIIGVVPQTFSLFPELTAEENIAYIGRLYGLSESKIRERSAYLLKKVSLYDHRHRIAGIFSGGMKQRLSLAASIMSEPRILFMDEPTTGLDPQSRIAMRELTKELNGHGMTIVYTTHDMDEAEKICDRIIIMDKGKIIGNGTSDELKHRIISGYHIEVVTQDGTKEVVADLKKLPHVTNVTADANIIHITVDSKDGIYVRISNLLHRDKVHVEEMKYREPSLEEVFIHLTKKDLRD